MSCSLYWRPVHDRRSVGGSQLRDAIREECGWQGRLDAESLPFLRGLAAAGVDGARELIEAIEKHGMIETLVDC